MDGPLVPKELPPSREEASEVRPGQPAVWRDRSAGRWKRVIVLAAALILAPYACRFFDLTSPMRCLVLLLAVLLLNLYEVMPLYCTALLIPVLGTLCAVLGKERGTVDTSTLLAANIFNNTSFMVLGALVINAVFTKCGLERRFMNFLLRSVSLEGPYFLLLIMLGGMLMCSVLYAGAVVLLGVLTPAVRESLAAGIVSDVGAKRLLLGVAFAANAGGALLPISSPVNLITISLLNEFDSGISIDVWVAVAAPVATATILGSWLLLLILLPGAAMPADACARQQQLAAARTATPRLTALHWLFLAVGAAAVLGITVFADRLEPLIGHPACLSLAFVVAVFGSGFLSRQEFCQLNWDLLALIGGTNVMAFLVRETGLGVQLSQSLTDLEFFTWVPFWAVLLIMVACVMSVATLVGHTLTGVLLMPLVVAIGVKLQAPQVTAVIVAVAIPLSMGLAQSSSDNTMSQNASAELGRRPAELRQRDFSRPGVSTSFLAVGLLFALGYRVAIFYYGFPPPVVVAGTGTPTKLQPKVVKENIPNQLREVDWTRRLADWKDFERRPGKKAFAVGRLEKGMRTRAWAATWNHEDQHSANVDAIRQCEAISKECSLIWPAPEKEATGSEGFLAVQARAFIAGKRRGGRRGARRKRLWAADAASD